MAFIRLVTIVEINKKSLAGFVSSYLKRRRGFPYIGILKGNFHIAELEQISILS